ncbi:MAG TPA: glycosyltransferase [Candidatus Limnocylindria bacterium]|nr:glycosyltransferase [Candidatus Limnocylindria bacterium]
MTLRPSPSAASRPPGLRVVMDARPLQDPGRAPATARYLEGLLGAFDADPLPGESFALLLQSDLDDPTTAFGRLEVVGRRLLPPTRLLRGGALAVDPFLLRGASLGAAWRADRSGAAGAVYHAAAGASPMLSGLPIVVTLLDLAPWELPDAFQRTGASRFGQRLRGRLIRDAAAVIVGSEAVARQARRQLHLRAARIHVVPLAPRPAFATAPTNAVGGASASVDGAPAGAATASDARGDRGRLGLPDRYLVYFGRFDARHDVATLLRALAALGGRPRPRGLPPGTPWPPRLLIVGASPDDRASLARAAGRLGAGDALVYAPAMPVGRLAGLVRGARAVVLPALSDAAGLAAIDAIAAGVPVVATSVGALPEVVGGAGILVEPRDPGRLAEALRTAWADDRVRDRLVNQAEERGRALPSWADVAMATRRVYAEVGVRASAASIGAKEQLGR